MCQKRNYFTRYDSVLLDPYTFSYFVRFYREVDTVDGRYVNSNDFVAIPLIPYEVYTQSTNRFSSLFDVEFSNCEQRPDYSDAQYFRRLTGYSNFTQYDVDIVGNITGKQVYGNWTMLNQFLNFDAMSTLSLNETWHHLFPSTCFMCASSGCYGENFSPMLDYHIILQFLVVVIYFVLLFAFKVYKKPSIKRRIGIPYGPILILAVMVTFTGLSRTCVGFWYSATLFFFIWWVLIYVTTTIRFYFLRNLYALINTFPKREKLLKILASQTSGFIVTVVLTFPIAHVLNLISVFYFVNEIKTVADVYRPIALLILLAMLWVSGLLSILLDFFLQRKSIRNEGIRKFFFFDDPFYLRVDLIATVLPLMIALTTAGLVNALVSSSNTQVLEVISILNGTFNTLACLSLVLISGGNVVIIEIFKIIRKRKESKLSLDHELKNADLLSILKEYCEKEFSTENYEFYNKLKSLQNQKFIKLKQLLEIESQFIRTYSKYEVNLPSSCKKNFYELFHKCESEFQIEFQLIWDCVATDLLMNLQDTFSRLQETSTYQKFLAVQELKEQNHV